MRPPFAAVLVASLTFASCASTPPPSPSPPKNGAIATNKTSTAPLELPTRVAESAPDCPIDQSKVPLASDRVLRCRGIPFNVTFPQTARVVQEKVGPGTSFFGLMQPAGATVLAVRPATFETITANDPQRGLDRSLDISIEALKSNNPHVDRRYDVRLGGTISGRALDFSYPLGSKKVAGTMRAFLVGGWIAVMVAGGPNDSELYRGSAASNMFLDSLRIAPRDPNPLQVDLEGGARLELPPDAWLNSDNRKKLTQNILRERMFALPDLGSILILQEQELGSRRCASLMSEQASRPLLEAQLRSSPNVEITSVERKKVGGAQVIFVEASVSRQAEASRDLPELATTAALFCNEPTLLMAIATGNRRRAENRATLESVLATYHSAAPVQQVAR